MTPEFKAKWIADLRTHEKTENLLREHFEGGYGYGYCCLGVACLTLGAEFKYCGGDEGEQRPILDGKVLSVSEKLSTTTLGMIGLSADQQADLILLNDSSNTFAEVIDYIEKEL